MYAAIVVGTVVIVAGVVTWAIWYVNQDKSPWSDR